MALVPGAADGSSHQLDCFFRKGTLPAASYKQAARFDICESIKIIRLVSWSSARFERRSGEKADDW